jgi:hypothetical protein
MSFLEALPPAKNPCTHCTKGQLGHMASLDAVDKIKYLSSEGFEHRTIQLIARRISGFIHSLFRALIRCVKFV